MPNIRSSPATVDLWQRTLLAATHVRSTTTAEALLHRMLLKERAALARKLGPGKLAEVEAKYHKPKPGLTTTAPPPVASTFVD